MGIIYKATNTINGKSYIGQTIYPLSKRSAEHEKDMLRGSDCKFHRAIRKYGFDSFQFEVIETVSDELLNERECYWIKVLDTYRNGYNSTLGGDGAQSISRQDVFRLWDIGKSINDIAEELKCSHCTIQTILQYYEKYDSDESKHRGKRNQMRSVSQYDLKGNYIRSFDSATEAAKFYNVDRTLISVCCRKKRWSGAGYQWRYSDDKPPKQYISEQKCALPVMQYSIAGIFVSEFDSINDAVRKTGINKTSISNCCLGKRKTAGGFIWKYKK